MSPLGIILLVVLAFVFLGGMGGPFGYGYGYGHGGFGIVGVIAIVFAVLILTGRIRL